MKKWVDLDEGLKHLGAGWSVSSFYRRLKLGQLKVGKHCRDDRLPGAQRAIWKLNIEAIEKDFASAAGGRR